MPKEKPQRSVLSQVLVAIVIALLAGGTAPWWWNEVKQVFQTTASDKPSNSKETPPTETPQEARNKALADFESVQAIYNRSKSAKTCVQFRRIVEEIRLYVGNKRSVPESFKYSVLYPSKKSNPTISDLAIDRITRVKRINSQCFD